MALKPIAQVVTLLAKAKYVLHRIRPISGALPPHEDWVFVRGKDELELFVVHAIEADDANVEAYVEDDDWQRIMSIVAEETGLNVDDLQGE